MTFVETSQNEVQTAFWNTLMPSGTLDATLAGYGLQAVYDFMAVPQNAPFDYLTIGEGYELAEDTLGGPGAGNDGFYFFQTLNLWSRQRGTQNPSLMIARLNQLFHRQPLTLATLKHVYTLRNRCVWMQDISGVIPVLHVSLQYKVYSTQ